MAKLDTCSAAELARLFDCSVVRVHKLVADGIIPKLGPGQFDKDACTTALILHMRQTIRQQGTGWSNADLKQSRVEYLAVQKKNAELKFQQASGKLLPIDDAEAMMLEIAAIFAGQKRSMGSRLAGKLAGMNDPKRILALLNRENDAILKNVSAKFSETANMAKAGRNTRAAAKAQPKPVGGRKPRVAARQSRTGAVAK